MVKYASLCCNVMIADLGSFELRRVLMTDRPRKSTRLTVSLEEQDYEALNQIALSKDVSLSWVIRQAVRQFIEKTRMDKESKESPADARHSNKT
jgi:hypothetical protein